MPKVHERCLKCNWWNFSNGKCDRIFKARMIIADDAGELYLETQPGLLPKDVEADFEGWLMRALGDYIDAWPGWSEIKRFRDKANGCAAEQKNQAIQEFGKVVSLARPLGQVQALTPEGDGEPHPDKNLDAHGLFKADGTLL